MSKAQLKSLVKSSGGSRNFADGVLESVSRQSMYGGNPLYFSGIDQINPKSTSGLTQMVPSGKHSGYSKMRGAGRKPKAKISRKGPIVPIHTSGELNQLNPDIGNYKPEYHPYGGSKDDIECWERLNNMGSYYTTCARKNPPYGQLRKKERVKKVKKRKQQQLAPDDDDEMPEPSAPLQGSGSIHPGLTGGFKSGFRGSGSIHPGLTGGLEPGLTGGLEPGLTGGQRIIGGFLGMLAAALAPVAINAAVKGIKKITGKGAKIPNKTQKRALESRVQKALSPLLTGMIAKHSLKIYPPHPSKAKDDPRFTLSDPFATTGSGFLGSILKVVAPAVIPLAAKGVGELFKKITGKGARCTCSKKDISGLGLYLKPVIDEVYLDMVPYTHGSGLEPGLSGGLEPGLSGGLEPGLSGGLEPGLTGGTRVSVGQQEYPGAMVTVGKGKYEKMDPAKKSAQARAKSKSNVWLHHVNKIKAQNPGLSYKEVLIKAKASYR